jgi:quinol-cytochrome oxidoreductase complex cytochrome b subunit
MRRVPLFGPLLVDTILAGPEVSDVSIRRFFVFHACALPMLFLPIWVFHINRVYSCGATDVQARDRSLRLAPAFVKWQVVFWLVTFNVIAALSVAFPIDVEPAADFQPRGRAGPTGQR